MYNKVKFHSAPSAEEFEDLSTFLKRQHQKKLQAKAEQAQRRIPDFFTCIKKEIVYDGDNEMSQSSPTMTMMTALHRTPSPTGKLLTPSPRGKL